MINRRDFLLASGVAAVSASWPDRVAARAPMATTQAPGFYRFPLGQFQITVLSDGRFILPPDAMYPSPTAEERNAVIGGSDFQALDKVNMQLNTLLVNTGDRLVLIDAGSRGKFRPPTTGRLLDNLAAAGMKSEDIDVVVISHAHGDHLWGVTSADNQVTFPTAQYVFSETELNFWTQPNTPVATGGWAATYNENLKAIAPIKDRIRTVKADEDIVTGVRAVHLPGHTPGHMGVQITSGQDGLLAIVDVVLNRTVSFEYPEWPFAFDYDREQGIKTRRSVLERAASEKLLLSTYHLPFPGIGHVTKAGTAYRWVPADYQWQLNTPT
jgi:glyoxylase-like metal-dependent hydrolase (beta-lactamase superfamily II)